MPQAHYEDDVTILAPVLASRLASLEKHIDDRLDRIERQMDGLDVHVREHSRLVEGRLSNHEERLCNQERQGWWRFGIAVASFVLALFGIRLPE